MQAIKLIEITSDLYAKRLVREIRATFEHGVYVDGNVTNTETNPRVHSVSFSKSGAIAVETNKGRFLVLPSQWEHAFFDGYGREIFASRSI
jgi:hypothetical protein